MRITYECPTFELKQMRRFFFLFFFAFILTFIGFAEESDIIPASALASESRTVDENNMRGDTHPDSCTRWQQWDFGVCVDKTDYPAYLDAFRFLQLITIPFLGGAGIFIVTATTPRISRRKRTVVIIPCAILLLFSSFVIFLGGGGLFYFF